MVWFSDVVVLRYMAVWLVCGLRWVGVGGSGDFGAGIDLRRCGFFLAVLGGLGGVRIFGLGYGLLTSLSGLSWVCGGIA